MKATDLDKLRGSVRDAAVEWGNLMVDRMLPEMPKIRAFAKNGIRNVISRYDKAARKVIDGVFLLVGDEDGTVDTDRVVDAVADIIDEMPVVDYDLYICSVEVGKGEIVVRFPSLMGKLQGVRITREDVEELKKMIKV